MAESHVPNLWGDVREIMRHRHFEQGHDEVDTINRLLRREPWAINGQAPFAVTRQNASVTAEQWPLERLWALVSANPSLITEKDSRFPHGAVIIARSGSIECLMDGRRRINKWQRSKDIGPHRVLIIEVQQQ